MSLLRPALAAAVLAACASSAVAQPKSETRAALVQTLSDCRKVADDPARLACYDAAAAALEQAEAKGDIVVYVLHHNPVAPDDIGFVRIPLSKITASQVHRIEDGTGGAILRTRVLDESPMNLKQQGMGESRGEIKIKVIASDDPSECLG